MDPARRQLRVDVAGAAVTLDDAFLSRPTAHGDPSLLHGYAITCHVAQGLTADRALVLGDDGLTSELAYTALSRGRIANHLYLAREPDDARAEYAPVTQSDTDPLDRLIATLRTSRATVLAIDTGRPDDERLLAQAERELAHARRERITLERRRWRPGRRAELVAAREQEAAVHERVARLSRTAVEQRHGRLPCIDERDAHQLAAAQRDRILERRLGHGHGHGIER